MTTEFITAVMMALYLKHEPPFPYPAVQKAYRYLRDAELMEENSDILTRKGEREVFDFAAHISK